MSPLLEAAAALGVSGSVLLLMTAALSGLLRLHSACIALEDELFRARQLEHLIDRTVALAGAGPAHPAPVAGLTADSITFASDLNGDGVVQATGSETTSVEVRQDGPRARIRLRFGGQTMTVLEAIDRKATLAAWDIHGNPATASSARLLELALPPRSPAPGDGRVPRLLFAVPAAASP